MLVFLPFLLFACEAAFISVEARLAHRMCVDAIFRVLGLRAFVASLFHLFLLGWD